MTRHDFLRFAIKNHPLNETEQIVGIDFYDPSKLELSIREEYHDKYNTEKFSTFLSTLEEYIFIGSNLFRAINWR